MSSTREVLLVLAELCLRFGRLSRAAFCYFPLFFGLPLHAAGAEILEGEKEIWNVHSHFTFSGQPGSEQLPRACSTVVSAFREAERNDFRAYCSFFEGVDVDKPPASVRTLFETWRTGSAHYAYLIAKEACSANESRSAVSILPGHKRNSESTALCLTCLKVDVVFATNVSGNWKLSSRIFDQKVALLISNRVSHLIYRQDSFSQESVERDVRRYRESFIEDMRKRGASIPELMSVQHMFQLQSLGIAITNWATWTNYYKPTFMTPPVSFDIREPVAYNFNEPIKAFHTFKRCLYAGDGKTILKFADPSGTAYLRRFIKQENDTNVSYHSFNANLMTRITVLLTATTTIADREYVMILWRAENAPDPRSGSVTLQQTFFVKNGSSYLLSEDLRNTPITDIVWIAGVRTIGITSFTRYCEIMKQSKFQETFIRFQSGGSP